VALRYVGGGIDEVRRISPVKPWTILGAGIVLAVGCALVPVLLDHPVLETGYVAPDVPVLGTVSLSSALVFDLGVYFVVIGVILMVVEAFGEPVDPTPDATSDGTPDSSAGTLR
jgi:multicomponent Na+:H+ antiporter subunit A